MNTTAHHPLHDVWASFTSELTKLKRRGLLLGIAAATLVTTVIGAIPMFFGLDSQSTAPRPGGGSNITRATLEAAGGLAKGVQASSSLYGVLVLCLAAIGVANEFSHGTIRNLLVRQPRRGQVLAGKVMATAVLATAVIALGAVMSVAVMTAMAPTASVSTSAWWSASAFTTLAASAPRVLGLTFVFGAFGTVLAFVTRSAAATIGIGVGWLLIGEALLGGISDALAKVMPGKLASALVSGGTTQIGMSLAVAGVIAWTAVLVSGAWYRFRQMELA